MEIIDAGLDRINIYVEGVNAEQYRDFSGHKMDYQQFVDNVPDQHRKLSAQKRQPEGKQSVIPIPPGGLCINADCDRILNIF